MCFFFFVFFHPQHVSHVHPTRGAGARLGPRRARRRGAERPRGERRGAAATGQRRGRRRAGGAERLGAGGQHDLGRAAGLKEILEAWGCPCCFLLEREGIEQIGWVLRGASAV